MERLLCDSDDTDYIRKERDNLDVLFNSTCSAVHNYSLMVSEDVAISRKHLTDRCPPSETFDEHVGSHSRH